jgi:glycosyltransferase involved in cell wall biosynthesis
MPGPARSVLTAVDTTPLLGVQTGVGVSVAGFIAAASADPAVDMVAYALSAGAGRTLSDVLPETVRAGRAIPIPASALLRAWAHFEHPVVEHWTGPVDVVHGTNFVVPPSRRAARLVTVHDLTSVHFPELCSPMSLRYPGLIRRALDRGASVHTVSQSMANEVVDHFGVDPARVHVVHNGLTPLPSPRPPDETAPPYILALGTTEPRKGLTDLVAAFDRIAGSMPDLQLKIAGPSGWGEDALDAACRSARHAGRIHRIGWVEDRSTLIAGARLLAYPSLYEGFGLPPLEAMSLGVPVVTTTAGAIPEVVGEAAVMVSPRNPQALAEGLLAAATDVATRERLIAAGLERARLFSWERSGHELAELYRFLAATNA